MNSFSSYSNIFSHLFFTNCIIQEKVSDRVWSITWIGEATQDPPEGWIWSKTLMFPITELSSTNVQLNMAAHISRKYYFLDDWFLHIKRTIIFFPEYVNINLLFHNWLYIINWKVHHNNNCMYSLRVHNTVGHMFFKCWNLSVFSWK